jgi:hypothetical protein
MLQMASLENWQYIAIFVVEAENNLLGDMSVIPQTSYPVPWRVYFLS